MFRNIVEKQCAKVVLRAQWLVTVGDSWEVKKRGDRSLVHCKTHFGQNPQISHIFFFLKHFFVDPSPDFVLRSQSYAVGDLGTGLPPLLTPSLDYL